MKKWDPEYEYGSTERLRRSGAVNMNMEAQNGYEEVGTWIWIWKHSAAKKWDSECEYGSTERLWRSGAVNINIEAQSD